MSTPWFATTKTILKAKPYASLTDGDLGIIFDPAVGFIGYQWDADHTTAESGYDNLEATDGGGAVGRWRLCRPYVTGMTAHDLFADFLATEHKTIAEARTDTGTLVIQPLDADPVSPTSYSIWIRTDLV